MRSPRCSEAAKRRKNWGKTWEKHGKNMDWSGKNWEKHWRFMQNYGFHGADLANKCCFCFPDFKMFIYFIF
jgi:hypothetical protein